MRPAYKPGHLRIARGTTLDKKSYVCVLCKEPCTGTANQVLCSKCKQTPAGQKYIAERKQRNMRAFLLRRKLGIGGTYK